VPDDAAFALESLGHLVFKLREMLPTTTPDEEVLRLAGERGCVLITCNRDDFLSACCHLQATNHPVVQDKSAPGRFFPLKANKSPMRSFFA
jgi:hypothetical protein